MATWTITISNAWLKVNAQSEEEAYAKAEQMLNNVLHDYDVNSLKEDDDK